MIRIYFETSAVNELARGRSREDAIATKAHQNWNGRGYFISPVVLWELLLTANADARDALIYFAQHAFEPVLLPSPEELVCNFIRSGCPLVEKKYELKSETLFASTWADICDVKEKTFLITPEQLAGATTRTRNISVWVRDLIRFKDVDATAAPRIANAQATLQQLVEMYGLGEGEDVDFEYLQRKRLVVMLALLLLCGDSALDMAAIQKFWSDVGIVESKKKISYLMENHPALFKHGPLHNIASMCWSQSERAFSRGVWFDSLHSVYITYADMFISADDHFRKLREEMKEHFPVINKVRHWSELNIRTVSQDVPPAESFLLRR